MVQIMSYRLFGRFGIFLFTVFAAVNFLLLVRQYEDVGKFLLNGGNTSGVSAFDDIFNLLGEDKLFLFHDFTVFDNIYGDVVVDKS